MNTLSTSAVSVAQNAYSINPQTEEKTASHPVFPLHNHFYQSTLLNDVALRLMEEFGMVSKENSNDSFTKFRQAMLDRLNSLSLVSDPTQKREVYQEVISELRSLRKYSEDSNDEVEKRIREKIQSLSYVIFTSLELIQHYGDCVDTYCSYQIKGALKLDTIKGDLQDIIRNLYENLKKNTINHTTSSPSNLYDFIMAGDIPTRLFTIQNRNNCDTIFLRFSTVVRDKKNLFGSKKIGISDEFKDYLRELDPTRPHLYINLMDRTSDDNGEVEPSHAIEELELDPEFKDKLRVITLDKHSSIYQWSPRMQSDKRAKSFKELLINHFFRSHFYWSAHLNIEEWKKELELIIDHVHTKYYFDCFTMRADQIQNFIELTYLHLILRLVNHFNPKFCNITCRFCVDRGPSTLALVYLHSIQNLHRVPSSKELETLTSLLFAPSIFLRGGIIQPYRLNIFLKTIEHLTRNTADMKSLTEDVELIDSEKKSLLITKIDQFVKKHQLELNQCIDGINDRVLAAYARYYHDIAPALIHWIDLAMVKASVDKTQIIFLHQNEKTIQKCAKILLTHFPGRYPNLQETDLVRAHLPLVTSSLKDYKKGLCVHFNTLKLNTEKTQLLIHTGFTPQDPDKLKSVLDKYKIKSEYNAFFSNKALIQSFIEVPNVSTDSITEIVKQFQFSTKEDPVTFVENPEKYKSSSLVGHPQTLLCRKVQQIALLDLTKSFDPFHPETTEELAKSYFISLVKNLRNQEEPLYCPNSD